MSWITDRNRIRNRRAKLFSESLAARCQQDNESLKKLAIAIKSEGVRCNCDLDNWEPEISTGHSWVCRIHKRAHSRLENERRNQS